MNILLFQMAMFFTAAALSQAAPIGAFEAVFRLPTDNQALLEGHPEEFYMYVHRLFEGKRTKEWTGGQYGFVRTPIRFSTGVYCTKFHEGLDIKPVKRDARGEPLDEVRPMAPGVVVHVSEDPRKSNYGRYVVVEHELPEGKIYSLYAHMASVSCKTGQRVGTGNRLGVMGHSGVGLDRERSHVHVELCLLMNRRFQEHYDGMKIAAPNAHGIYNGLNLVGFDASAVLLACREGRAFSLKQHFSGLEEQYRVRVPFSGAMPDILLRHPFLWNDPDQIKHPASLDISFTGAGLPFRITPSKEAVPAPRVVAAKPWPFDQKFRTLSRVTGSSKEPVLTNSGKNHINLLMLGAQ